jgi:hypothetical protein
MEKMLSYSQDELAKGLELQGMKFTYLEISQEGDYLPSDAEWNYKDVPHLNHVHELVDATYASIGDSYIATINMQKIFGFRFPLTVFNYDSKPGRQTYFTNFLFYQLIIETWAQQISPSRTRVTTRYAIGSLPVWQIFAPLLKWVLKRNYKALMKSDVAMRTRRGELRAWGYSFKGDNKPYSFRETMKIQLSNVIPPADVEIPKSISVSVDDLIEKKRMTVGRADHLGLRLEYEAGEIRVFARMCPHEGANLDESACADGRLTCPWHGRKFPPAAIIPTESGAKEIRSENYRFQLEGRSLSISAIQTQN